MAQTRSKTSGQFTAKKSSPRKPKGKTKCYTRTNNAGARYVTCNKNTKKRK